MEQEEFNEINKTIKINEEATKKVLEHRKFKKLNHLKYNQRQTPTAVSEGTKEQPSNS